MPLVWVKEAAREGLHSNNAPIAVFVFPVQHFDAVNSFNPFFVASGALRTATGE
jgi:hypothetical protein